MGHKVGFFFLKIKIGKSFMKYVKWHMYLPETLQLQPRVVNASEIFTHLWVRSYSPELFTCKVTWSYKQAFFNLEWSLQSNLKDVKLGFRMIIQI